MQESNPGLSSLFNFLENPDAGLIKNYIWKLFHLGNWQLVWQNFCIYR